MQCNYNSFIQIINFHGPFCNALEVPKNWCLPNTGALMVHQKDKYFMSIKCIKYSCTWHKSVYTGYHEDDRGYLVFNWLDHLHSLSNNLNSIFDDVPAGMKAGMACCSIEISNWRHTITATDIMPHPWDTTASCDTHRSLLPQTDSIAGHLSSSQDKTLIGLCAFRVW